MEFAQIRKLAKALTDSKRSKNVTEYSMEDGTVLTAEAMEETLRSELFEICKTRSGYEKNKWDLVIHHSASRIRNVYILL